MFGISLFRIRNSIRAFAHTPGISLALVATIAIGVGSNSIVSGFIAGLAHPKSPFPTSDSIVSIFANDRSSDAGPISLSEYQALRTRANKFAWIEAARIAPRDVAIDGKLETVTVAEVMPHLADAMNVPIKNGAVLSNRLWNSEFGEENRAAARTIRVNNTPFPIAGVAPKTLESIYADRPIDLWMPFAGGVQNAASPSQRDLWVLAQLRSGVTVADAQLEIETELKESNIVVIPYSGTMPRTARGLASIVTLLKFIAGSVFLIACINVASLLLGRALERSSETSLRVALGATRRALSGELLTDSFVIAVVGAILGLLLAIGAKKVIPSLLFQEDAERLAFVPPIASLITSFVVSVSITVLAGMLPMVATVTDRPWTVLQRERGSSSTKVVRLRSALVVLQIGFCCVLVIFAALLLEGLHNALKTGMGQTLGNPILVTVQSSPFLNFRVDYFKAVEQAAKSVPNLAPVAWTTELPGSQPMWRSFRTQPWSNPLREVDLGVAPFTRDNRDQPELEPTAGRIFNFGDQSCEVAVINGAAASRLSGDSTIGEKVLDPAGRPAQIIGVVTNPSADPRNSRPTIYFNPLSQIEHAPSKAARFKTSSSSSSANVELNVNYVSAGYMSALGLRLVAGYWIPNRQENSDPCRPVGVINQEAADLFFGGKPLGAGIIDQEGNQTEIIGVVRSQELGIFQHHPDPTVFIPAWQEYPLRMTLILKASNPSNKVIAQLRRKIEHLPGEVAPPLLQTLDAQLARSALAPLRIATLISLSSALAALTVSMIGVFSIQSHVYRERRKILALHLAFGAQTWRIFLKTLFESGQLVLMGCVAGTLLSIVLQRAILSRTGILGQPSLRAWLLALLVPVVAILTSGAVAAFRSLGLHPMAIMRDR